MINEENKKICSRILNAYGEQAQMYMVVEELAELQKEILKNINRKRQNIAEIVEETADVYIMLEQLLQNYGIKEKVKQKISEKLNKKTADMLKKGELK